ncbi:MAG: PcfJ domain-containing protein [Limisphaerales bacterium]
MHLSKIPKIVCPAKDQIDRAIKIAREDFGDYADRRAALDQLLLCVWERTRLLRLSPTGREPSAAPALFALKRLQNFAHRRAFWIRPLEDWRAPKAGRAFHPSPRVELRSLAEHLFARYATPAYLQSAWDLAPGPAAFRQQSWFIRIARGASFRALELPIPLTERMRHYMRHAPDDFTIYQAMRFSEVLGLGGEARVARHIAKTRLGRDVSNSHFWRRVLGFFISNTDFPATQLDPAIEFIQAMRFDGEEIPSAHGCQRRASICPDFRIEGRTTNSLLRLMHRWHLETADSQRPVTSWPASGIDHFRFLDQREDGMDREWSIVELCSSAALIAEGRAMSHCVARFIEKCRRRHSSIWSLRLRIRDQEKRMATIEVAPNRRIVQIRARCNRFAGDRSQDMIIRWSKLAGLKYWD